MTSTQEQTDALNSLLRGELAATETYNQALGKMEKDPIASSIRQIRDEHRECANSLREMVHQHGGKPDQGSGAWGTWAKLVEGTAKWFGNTGALKALKEGEEHGLKTYENALNDKNVSDDVKTLVRSTLLPRTKAHLPALDKLMAAQK